MADRAPGFLTGLPPHDLWFAGEQCYLLPTGVPLPPGSLRLVALDGRECAIDPLVGSAFAIDEEEAAEFAGEGTEEVLERLAEAVGVLLAVILKASDRVAEADRSSNLETTLAIAGRGLLDLLATDEGRVALRVSVGSVAADLDRQGASRLAEVVRRFGEAIDEHVAAA